MTNERVRRGFMEVYNEFRNRYKNNTPTRDSGEWERIRTWSVVLQKKYPFLKETILSLEVELGQRMGKKDGDGPVPGGINRQV